MQVGAIQQDRRTDVAGRPNDVRTHIGVRLAVIPLSGVVAAIQRTAPSQIYAGIPQTVHSGDQNVDQNLGPVNRQFEKACQPRSSNMP